MATIDEITFLITANNKQFDRALKQTETKLDTSTKNMVKDLKRVDSGVLTLGKTFKALGGILATIGIANLGRQMLKAASDMQQLNARLIATTGSAKNASEAMLFLSGAARKQSVDVITLADGYNRLLPAVNNGTISLKEMRTVLSLANDNIKAFGLSTSETQGLFLGLSQTLTSGTVTMEDLRQVTDRLPGVFAKTAQAMGKSSSELRKLISTGTVGAKDIIPALTDAFRANEGAAEKMGDTIASAGIRLKNSFRDFKSTVAESTKATAAFVTILDRVDRTFISLATDIKIADEAFNKIDTDVINSELVDLQKELDETIKRAKEADKSSFGFLDTPAGGFAEIIDQRIELIEKLQTELDVRRKLAKTKKKDEEDIKKESASIAKLVKNLQFEIEISRLNDRAKNIEIVRRKAIAAVMKEHNKTHAQAVDLYKQEIQQVTKLTGTLFDLEKAEKDAADAAEELAEQARIAAENIQEGLADAISDVVSNLDDIEGVGKRVFNNIAKFGIDAFSQIAAQQILGSATGGGGGGGISGGSALSGLGSVLGSAGGIVDTIGAGLGFGAGSSVVGAAGPLLPAAGAGALTSTALSTIIGAALPIAGIAAIAIPLALSAFKKEGVKASEFATEFGGATTFGSKGQSVEFAKNLAAQLSTFTGGVQQAAGATFQGDIRGGFNSKGGGAFLQFGDTRLNFDPDNAEQAQQAFNDLTEILLDTANVADKEVAEALRNLQLDGLSAAEAIRAVGIASGVLANQFNTQLEQEILKLTDARAFEIQQIEKQTAALRDEAIAIGANVELVEKLGQLRLDEATTTELREQETVQKDITRALEASRKEAEGLSNQFAKISTNLMQTALNLQLGNLSALSPEQQLDISRKSFTDLSRRAALGDVEAAQQLPGAASAFLQESRNFNASNAAFKSDFASVQNSLSGAGEVFSRQSGNQTGVVDAINNSIKSNSGGLQAIVLQLNNLVQQTSAQTQTLRDLTIKMSA